jgi:hypothetical protein
LRAAFCACQAEAEAETTTTPKEAAMPTEREEAIRRFQEMSDEDYDALGAEPGDDDDDEGEEDYEEEAVAEGETAGFSASDDPAVRALQAQIDAMEAKERKRRQAEIDRDAVMFAKGEILAGRASVHEEAGLASLMSRAMLDDESNAAVVTFSRSGKGVTGTRAEALRATCAQRRPQAFGPRIPDRAGDEVVGFDDEGAETAEQKRARIDRRLANTPLGESILARRNGAARP